jgi:hypothetical protein
MIEIYDIGIENNILEGADVLNYTTDLLGQLVLVRHLLSLGPHSRYSHPIFRLIVVGLYGGGGGTLLCFPYSCPASRTVSPNIILGHAFVLTGAVAFAMVGMGVYLQFAHDLPAGASSTKLVNTSANIALGVPVGTDLLLTLLIIGRIYYLAHWAPELLVSARRIQSVISIVIESGALVIAVQFITSVLVLRGIPAQNIMLCVLAQVYVRFSFSFCDYCWILCQCIAPTLIILRIGLGKAIDTTSLNATITSLRYADAPTSVTDRELETKKQSFQASSSSGSGSVSTALNTNNV